LQTGSHRQYLAPQDGLTSNDVRTILRAADGALWAATAGGLALHDEATDRWTVLQPSHPELPSPSMTALTQALDGSLWVGFEQLWDPDAPAPGIGEPGAFVGGGLARFDPRTESWSQVYHAEITDDRDERPAGIPSENVTSVAFGSDGLLWVGTRPYYRWSEQACGRPTCPPQEAAYVSDGGGLAATPGPSVGWRHWNTLTDVCPASTSYAIDLQPDRDGRMWLATRGRGLQLYRGGMSTVNCEPATGHVYYRPSAGGLPGPHVWGLDLDAEGRIWMTVGESNKGLGIATLSHGDSFDGPGAEADDEWHHIGLDGFTDGIDAVPTGIDEHGGDVVVGTRDERRGDGWGVKLGASNGEWRTYATADHGLPSNQVTAVAAHPTRGEVWFATRRRGVARWTGTTWETWRAFERLAAVGSTAEEARRGTETITLTMSVAVFNQAFPPGTMRLARLGDTPVLYELGTPMVSSDGEGTRVDVRPPLPHRFPAGVPIHSVEQTIAGDAGTSIAFDDSGQVWIGATRSLVRPGPPHDVSSRCETFPDCWRDGGVAAFDGSAWTVHNPRASENTLPIRSVLALAKDTSGRMWAGTGVPTEDRGDGVAIHDPRTGAWQLRSRASEGQSFGGDVVTGVAVDPLSGDVWLATHHTHCRQGALDDPCDPNGRIGGGISRWDGSQWSRWTKESGGDLRANGVSGNFASILFDAGRSRVWAGAWAEGYGGVHWMRGEGIDAAVNQCGRACSGASWQGRVFRDDGVVRAQAVDAEGRLWVGASRDRLGIIPHRGGVKVYDGGRSGDGWLWLRTDYLSNEVTALGRQGDGMWVGTYDGGAARWWPVELTPGAYLPVAGR
jgi:ligand-binding sensor domain-containing protein